MKKSSALFIDTESHATPALESNYGHFFIGFYSVISFLLMADQIRGYVWEEGSWNTDLSIIKSLFAELDTGFRFWVFLHFICFFIVYPLTSRFCHFKKTLQLLSWFLGTCVLLLSVYITSVFQGMGGATKIFISLESIRIVMKIISFMTEMVMMKETITFSRNNNEDDLNNNEKNQFALSSITHFLYFMFAPTVIYSPSYPMRKSRNWSRMFLMGYLIISLMFYGLKVHISLFLPLSTFGKEVMNANELFHHLLMFTGIFSYFLAFCVGFGWFHAWHNMWGEMLRFADRRFYSDYYTQHKYTEFFLKWNLLAQNWFYRYIYQPLNVMHGKKIAGLATVVVSGILHDYCTVIGTGLLFPYYIIMFPICIFIAESVAKTMKNEENPRLREYLFINGLPVSQGFVHCLMTLEYYCRQNCPAEEETSFFMDMITPRVISCILNKVSW